MSEVLLEKIIIYSSVAILCLVVLYFYLKSQWQTTKLVEQKIARAKEHGLFEPVSLHPVINEDACINCGSCVAACPEKDILGIRNGRATTINASNCVGHGACFHACPIEAISLVIGTDKRGVDLPHVKENFESNISGIFLAGELAGMGLIKNAVKQGQQAVDNIYNSLGNAAEVDYDLIVVGAGPTGISASLQAKKRGMKFLTLEQETLGGTVFTFPRSKVVMTAPMELPLHGKVKLFETSKTELLDLWENVLNNNEIHIHENCKVNEIIEGENYFTVITAEGDHHETKKVLLAIGRRGTPRKLNISGELTEKVAYRLLEPEHISNKKIVVVGGGDSAIESALLLTEQNQVTLSYRKEVFSRLKPKNRERIEKAIADGAVDIKFCTNLVKINNDSVEIKDQEGNIFSMANDLVYIFAGGELPTKFLEKIGIKITRRYGHALLKSKNYKRKEKHG